MVIGLRAFPDGFTYVVLDGTQDEPNVIAFDRVTLPKNCGTPGALTWVRRQIAETVQNHGLRGACIKGTEPLARKKSTQRFQIEAVLMEYLSTERNIECSIRIKSQLKRDIKSFNDAARYLERVVSKSDALADLNAPQFQEAALAAISELPSD